MMRSRFLLGAVVAGAFITILAALPAPRLSVSRTPDVIPKHTPPGDVRNLSLAADSPYVQAALEVFDGTDWEIYYWTDSIEITPQASAVTGDIVEQRWARIAVGGGHVMIAWIEDTDVGSNIRATSKRDRGYRYSWRPAATILTETSKLGGLAVALTPDGKPVIAYVKEQRVWVTWPPGSSTVERVTSALPGAPAERNPSISIADDGRVAIAIERTAGISLAERTASGWRETSVAKGGRRPEVAPDRTGWRVGYTEGGGAGARVAVRSTTGGLRRYNIRLGSGAPVAITFDAAVEGPIVGSVAIEGKRQFGWLVRPGGVPTKVPVPTSKRTPSPSPSTAPT